MSPAQAAAIARLRKWSDPRTGGDPTRRMMEIWKAPVALRNDVAEVMRLLDALV